MRQINDAGVDLIKRFEGCRLTSYQDQAGIWTIGYGATGPGIEEDVTWTQRQVDDRFLSDLKSFEYNVQMTVPDSTTDNQFAALVSFTYNLGLGSLVRSTLLKLLKAGDIDSAGDEFLKWDRAGGKEDTGLLKRREAERNLFLS